MRSIIRTLSWVLAVAAGAAAPVTIARAADYPERPIELIVPWGPGGGADQLARLVSKLMEPAVGRGVPVVNVAGATGATGMAKLLAAPADGYSMAVYIADSHALLAGKDARWSMNDIVPVAVLIQAPSFIFVAQESRFKTWADFEKEARANPGKLKVATLGFGSVDDFSLRTIAGNGIKFVQVPFSKPSERYVSILGGHADALYEQAGDVALLHSRQADAPDHDVRRQALGRVQGRPELARIRLQHRASAVPRDRGARRHAARPAEDAVRRFREDRAVAGIQPVPRGRNSPRRTASSMRSRRRNSCASSSRI